jgi:predicted PurR-regulated permease PerM
MASPSGEIDRWLPRERVLLLVFAAATLIVFYLCYRVALPFVPALTWALVLAVLANPLHERLERRVPNATLAAGIAVALVTLVIALPAAFVVRQAAHEALERTEAARAMLNPETWKATLERYPRLAPLAAWMERQTDLQEDVKRGSAEAAKGVRGLLARTVDIATTALVTVFVLFYFLRDKRRLLRGLQRLVPLAPPEVEQVSEGIHGTIHALVFGTLTVAAVQGTLGGLIFWWLGLPAPILWGAVMALLSILPLIGAALVWVPAAAFLALQGDIDKALILTAWGALAIGLVDNLLYPVLVKNRLRLHTLPVFIAVLGGLFAFGATGVVLGPLILALTIALIDVWRRRMAFNEVESGVDRPA